MKQMEASNCSLKWWEDGVDNAEEMRGKGIRTKGKWDERDEKNQRSRVRRAGKTETPTKWLEREVEIFNQGNDPRATEA